MVAVLLYTVITLTNKLIRAEINNQMSTRCNILVRDGEEELWFYRHSDGYPEGAMPLLQEFMEYVKSGAIRDNISQASGWLVYLGAKEYGLHDPDKIDGFSGWKVGSIEPTTGQHGDIEYLYVIDLDKKTITIKDLYEEKEQNT